MNTKVKCFLTKLTIYISLITFWFCWRLFVKYIVYTYYYFVFQCQNIEGLPTQGPIPSWLVSTTENIFLKFIWKMFIWLIKTILLCQVHCYGVEVSKLVSQYSNDICLILTVCLHLWPCGILSLLNIKTILLCKCIGIE